MTKSGQEPKRSQSAQGRTPPDWPSAEPPESEPPLSRDKKPFLTLSRGLAIRRWQYSDVPALAAFVSPAVNKGYLDNTFEDDEGESGAYKWIRETFDPQDHRTTSHRQVVPTDFAITMKDKAIGSIGMGIDAKEESTGFRTSEIRYMLAEEHWGSGIMTEVVKVFVPWLFAQFKYLNRVEAFVISTFAPGSSKVLEKAGFRREGAMRQTAWKEGIGYADCETWGILRDECRDAQFDSKPNVTLLHR